MKRRLLLGVQALVLVGSGLVALTTHHASMPGTAVEAVTAQPELRDVPPKPRPLPVPRANRSMHRHPVTRALPRPHLVQKPVYGGSLHDVTEYCDTGSRTASGKWPEPGMVAVLDRSIPFGTRVSIQGMGVYTVEDWVGWGTDFDIFTHSCSGADQFGRQHLRVTILGR